MEKIEYGFERVEIDLRGRVSRGYHAVIDNNQYLVLCSRNGQGWNLDGAKRIIQFSQDVVWLPEQVLISRSALGHCDNLPENHDEQIFSGFLDYVSNSLDVSARKEFERQARKWRASLD